MTSGMGMDSAGMFKKLATLALLVGWGDLGVVEMGHGE